MTALSLEQRIAVALSDSIKSDAVAALIQEVEAAAQAADENATRAREEALDPAVVVDTAKVGAAVVTAELTRDRLQAALPRLRALHGGPRAGRYRRVERWASDSCLRQLSRTSAFCRFCSVTSGPSCGSSRAAAACSSNSSFDRLCSAESALLRAIASSQVATRDRPWNRPAWRQTSKNTSLTRSSAADLSPTKRARNRKTRTLWRANKICIACLSPAAIERISATSDVSEVCLPALVMM
jgi:hypothetical protein